MHHHGGKNTYCGQANNSAVTSAPDVFPLQLQAILPKSF